jgi:hypothetical protein
MAAKADPISEEGKRILDADPELRADLRDFVSRLDRGDVDDAELVAHSVVRRRLGLQPEGDEAAAG